MKLRLLTDKAYNKISTLPEALHKQNRGYGIVTVKINGLVFALPLRSNLKHSHGFKTILRNKQWNGVDYSKAIIVTKGDLRATPFKPRDDKEYEKLKKNKDKIHKDFNHYLSSYISHPKNNQEEIRRRFGYTTLANYHAQLGNP